jgi:hypothetical protein
MRFDTDFELGFRGGIAVFVVVLAVLGAGFFVATADIFLGSMKVFLNTAEKFGMFNTYGCARAHAR